MKMSWHHQPDCTTEEANELILKYQSLNIKVEKHLAADYKSWTVSALLPEEKTEPRPSRRWQNPMWSRI